MGNLGGSFLLGGGSSGTLSNTLNLNRAFQNQGSLTLSGASISGSGSIQNSGSITVPSATSSTISTLLTNIASTTVGTIQVNGTLAATNFPTSDGIINIGASGTLSTGNASLTNSSTGVITSLAGGTLNLGSSGSFIDSGNATFGGAYNVATTNVSAGTVAFNNTASTATLNLSGGAVNGSGNLSVTTDFNQTGGTFGTTFGNSVLNKSGTFTLGAAGFGAVNYLRLIATGNIALGGPISAGGNVTLSSPGTVTQTAAITASGLELLGAGGSYTLTNTGNNVATLAANTGSVSYIDSNPLGIGTVNTTNGINATGTVDVSTQTGNLTLGGNITAGSTAANAITLNAGRSTAAGTSPGGDVIVSGSPTISTGAGGRATLYTGSVSGSTGLASLIGSGSGNFRYNSDESAANYSVSLGSGKYGIFRERPTITITANSPAAITYGDVTPALTASVTGMQNGDTSAQALSTPATVTSAGPFSTAGKLTAGAHTLTAAGAVDQLGYGLSYVGGTLNVAAKTLTVASFTAQNKIYDGTNAATVSGGTLSGGVVGTDAVSSHWAHGHFCGRQECGHGQDRDGVRRLAHRERMRATISSPLDRAPPPRTSRRGRSR